jgi:asparagine synthase (glutamine-hydrolysing)
VVKGERLADSGFFDADVLKRVVNEHQSGLRDHSSILWSLLMFDGFLRQTAQSVAPASAPLSPTGTA